MDNRALIDKAAKAIGLTYEMLSAQQIKAAEWVIAALRGGKENEITAAVIEAVAGSGKTTTLKLIIHLIKIVAADLRILYLVFGKRNQTEAAKAIPASLCDVSTFHSKGYQAFRNANRGVKFEMASWKIKDIMKLINVPAFLCTFVDQLVHYAKCRAIGVNGYRIDNLSSYDEIIEHYGLMSHLLEAQTDLSLDELCELGIRYAIDVINLSIQESYAGKLDFNDQLLMPVLDKACVKTLDKYDVVLIDEGQDTSLIRRLLAEGLAKKDAIVIMVGDRYQAIMGFAGADNDAMDKFKEAFDADELPLTVSYRCPKAVINHVIDITGISHIQPAPNAKEGSVLFMSHDEFLKLSFDPTDAIMCRNTRPLVELAYKLMAAGIACKILGRDLGQGLIKLSKKWKSVKTLDKLAEKLGDFRAKMVQKLTEAKKEDAAANLSDQIDCLLFLIDSMPAGSTLENLQAKIESMFATKEEDENGLKVLTLMTCHKSKGLEFDTVYWYGREKYQPSKYARKDWQKDQERNLIYVAGTRAKDTLIEVSAA